MSGLIKRVSAFLRLGRYKHLVGTDLDDNLFFELPNRHGDPDPRRTRRIVQFKDDKQMGEYDQSTLSHQWLMWLRHSRRSAPTIEELTKDRERIEIVQHNARVLEQRDTQRRLQLEAKAQQETLERQKLVEESYNRPAVQGGRAIGVPTSSVSDMEADREAQERVLSERQKDPNHVVQERKVDMEVWEASRRRVEEKDAQATQTAVDARSEKRAALDRQDAERQRAREYMQRSPLAAFDPIDQRGAQRQPSPPPPPRRQDADAPRLNRNFGKATGPGEDWKPQEWSPRPLRR